MNQTPIGHSISDPTPTRREMLGHVQVGTFALLLVVLGVILIWFAMGQSEWIDLGRTDEFEPDIPTSRVVTLRDKSTLSVWVVHLQDQWFVFAGRVPFESHYPYQWQPVTQRFEDPLSGAKFSRQGEFLDPCHGFAGKTMQDLDPYPPTIRDGHLLIDPHRVIHAPPFVAPS